LLATLLLVLSLAACDVCDGSRKIACPTCDGKTTLLLDCRPCAGRGKRACRVCGPESEAIAVWKGVTPGKGVVPCPHLSCEKGVVRGKDASQKEWKDKCRLCAGRGTLGCPFCDKTDLPCEWCGGKKKVAIPCVDCRATGAIACPSCVAKIESTACPLCAGEPAPECSRCGATGHVLVPCVVCRGADVAACLACFGAGRQPCVECRATGTYRYEPTPRTIGVTRDTGKRSCATCDGKGTVDCTDCKQRKTRCWRIDRPGVAHEKGQVRVDCESCAAKGKIECGGCARGTWRGIEVAALGFLAHGQAQKAVNFLIEAQTRAEKWFASGPAGEASEERERRLKDRDAARERLRHELREAEERATANAR